MEVTTWIWALVWLVELGWVTRLWQLGLNRKYPILTTYLLFSAAHSIAAFLAMRTWGQNSVKFGWLWIATQPVLWALLFCVVLEAYQQMLSPYKGLGRLRRFGTYCALGTAALVVLGMNMLDPAGNGKDPVWLGFWMRQQRGVFLALTVVCTFFALVGAYCRLTVPRNVLVLFSVFGLIFLTQAVLSIFRNHFGPAFRETKDFVSASLYIASVLAGTFTFSVAGENRPRAPAHPGWGR